MSLITHIEEDEYGGLEGFMEWKLFGEEITVSIEEGAEVEYAEKCAEALNSLPEETVNDIWEAAKRYCLFFKNLCEENGDDFDDFSEMSFEVTEETPAEKLKSEISPSVLIVDKPEDDRIGYHIECNCSWEPEHGLEITILDGKLLYLGAFESRYAWAKFDPDDEWNFANGK